MIQFMNFQNSVATLCISFLGFYIGSLAFSPIYFSVISGAALLFGFYKPRVVIDITWFFGISFVLYILICSVFNLDLQYTNTLIGMLFSIAIYFLVSVVCSTFSRQTILLASQRMIDFSIVLLIFECYYRLTHPVYIADFESLGRPELEFYYYKINSIMYIDSNFVGIFAGSLLFFQCYINGIVRKRSAVQFLLLSVIALLTISRASIFAIVVTFSVFLWLKLATTKRIVLLFFLILIAAAVVSSTAGLSDDSFDSKLYLVKSSIEFVAESSFSDVLFGLGVGNSFSYLDMGPHNIFVMYLLETGVVGLSLFIAFWLSIFFKSNFATSSIMLFLLINGFSLASYYIPFVYGIFAVVISLENNTSNHVIGSC